MPIISIFSFSHNVFRKQIFKFSVTFILSSANAFNLDQSIILLFGIELSLIFTEHGSNRYVRSVENSENVINGNQFCYAWSNEILDSPWSKYHGTQLANGI